MMDERIASIDTNRTHVLWTPYNMRKSPFWDHIYRLDSEKMEHSYIDMQTGREDDAENFYFDETHNVKLPHYIDTQYTKFA